MCNIICDYALLNTNTKQTDSRTVTISHGESFSYQYEFTVPDYSTTLVTYAATFECSDSPSCYSCDGLISCLTPSVKKYPDKIYSIDITPALNDAENSAKLYIESNLENNEAKLTEISIALQRLNNKINGLPKNVKIGAIKASYEQHNTDFNSVNSNANQVNNLFNIAHYIEAKNTFDLTQFNSLLAILPNINTLSIQIDEIVKRHNAVTKELNNLYQYLNNNQKLAIAVDKQTEYDSLKAQITNLVNNFENGNFDTYDEIETQSNAFVSSINNYQSEWSNLLLDVLTRGTGLLDDMLRSVCKNKGICGIDKVTLSKDILDVDKICGAFNSINSEINSAFEREMKQYTANVDNISAINERIMQDNNEIKLKNTKIESENEKNRNLNAQLKSLNELTKQINGLIKKNHLAIDNSNCFNKINPLLSSKTEDFINAAIAECSILKENAANLTAEKEKSVLFKLKRLFFFFSKFDYNKLQTISEFTTQKILPLKEELKTTFEVPIKFKVSKGTADYQAKYCNIKEDTQALILEEAKSSDAGEITKKVNVNLTEKEQECCFFNVCKPCCKGDECEYDEKSYPVIFLHGHSFLKSDAPEYSLSAFDNIQNYLIEQGYISRGILLPTDNSAVVPSGLWGKGSQPSTVKVTYYLRVYNNEGQIINEPSKTDSIENYALRLKNMIELTKSATNRAKVNIVAHSMGGLVAREYIRKFGGDSVNKLIMIGTPNHGIFGLTDSGCGLVGASKECSQMNPNDAFITTLNSGGDETPYDIKYYTITGTGCVLTGVDGDGVVRSTSVPLNGATNYNIVGKCSGSFNKGMHSDLLNPSKYPEVLEKIKSLLKE